MKRVALSLVAVFMVSCMAKPAPAPAPVKESLYRRLGEKQGITAVVDEFVANCASDKRIKTFFSKTAKDKQRMAKFKENLVTQICETSGGPCKYSGKDMKSAHQGMKINDTQFDALVEDLTRALDKYKVGGDEKKELVGALAPMKPLIVKPAPAKKVVAKKGTATTTKKVAANTVHTKTAHTKTAATTKPSHVATTHTTTAKKQG